MVPDGGGAGEEQNRDWLSKIKADFVIACKRPLLSLVISSAIFFDSLFYTSLARSGDESV